MNKLLNPLLKIFILLVVFASGTSVFADGVRYGMPVDLNAVYNNASSSDWYFPDVPTQASGRILNICWGGTTPDFDAGYSPCISGVQFSNIYENHNEDHVTSSYYISNGYSLNTIAPGGAVPTTPGDYYVWLYTQACLSYNGFGDCTSYGTDYIQEGYVQYYLNGTGDWIYYAPDFNGNDTRIIELTPENNEVITATTSPTDVVYNFVYFIAEEDIGQTFSVQVFLKNYDQNTLFGALSDSQIEFLDFTATSSGIGGLSGYMTLPNGNYMIKGQLKKSLWGFTLPKIGVLDEVENQFIVGSSTYIGALIQGSRNALNGALASTSAMSFASSSATCNPISSNVSTLFLNPEFSPISCFSFLFVPDSTLINESLTNVRVNVLQSFPIGYVTDFVEIMATTSTSTLTVIDAYVPSILPGGGSHVHLDLYRALDWALYATSSRYNNVSASSTKSLFEITNGYWKIIVYLGALFYILSRLLGTRIVPNGFGSHGSLSDTNSNDDSYALKEKLYNMSKRK